MQQGGAAMLTAQELKSYEDSAKGKRHIDWKKSR